MIYLTVCLMYRLRIEGRHHLPRQGACLLVCNHVSYMDALILGGSSPRPLRFVMDQPIFNVPVMTWLFRLVGAIPVESERRDPGSLRRTLNNISDALEQGEIVMVFPEGRLTPDGETQPFRRGIETILARDQVPVIPAALDGLWGSWTSHYNGPALRKRPCRFRARVRVCFGEPLDVSADGLPDVALRRYLESRVRVLKASTQGCAQDRPSSDDT